MSRGSILFCIHPHEAFDEMWAEEGGREGGKEVPSEVTEGTEEEWKKGGNWEGKLTVEKVRFNVNNA